MNEVENAIEYRGYVFVNRALSSIQKGVQGAHALVELTSRYCVSNISNQDEVLREWRKNHKTLVFVDCGFHQELLEHYLTASSFCERFKLPHALFVEDDWTMNSMATAFAIIVPSTIYDLDIDEYYAVQQSREQRQFHPSSGPYPDKILPPDIEFYLFLKGFKLAI